MAFDSREAPLAPLLDVRLTRRRFLTGAGMGTGGLLLAACTGSERPTTQRAAPPPLGSRDPRTLVVAVDADVANLDPATNIDWAFGLAPVYDTLVRLDGRDVSRTVPSLATEFEPNADSSVWTCRLGAGVVFQDGTKCDADAVKASITRSIELPTGIGFLWGIEDPDKQIVVVDPASLRFDLGGPRPFFNLEVASQYGFYIANAAAAMQHSKGPEDLGNEWLRSHPVGTGPYTVQSLQVGQQTVFEKFPRYWRGWSGNHFDKVIALTIPDPSARRRLLQNGEADVIWPGTPTDIAALEADPRFTVDRSPTFTVQYIALGMYGPLADPRARQAMNHAFDTAGYIKGVERDTVTPTHGAFPDLLATTDKSISNIPFDLNKAKQLFDAAGVRPGTELTYEYYTGFGGEAGSALQASLSKIGLRLKLIEKSYSGFIDDYLSDAPPAQRSNMYFFSWWPNYNHPWSWAQALFTKSGWGSAGGNAGLYHNPEVDRLVTAMENQPIDASLEANSRRAQQILAIEDPPWIPIAQEPVNITYRDDIGGVVFNPLYVLTLDFYQLHRQS
jgi:peptide/nickel transport system substrate-binding protein